MVYRNKKQQKTINAGRLGAGFIGVCLETRWLGYFGGFHVLEPPCSQNAAKLHDFSETHHLAKIRMLFFQVS